MCRAQSWHPSSWAYSPPVLSLSVGTAIRQTPSKVRFLSYPCSSWSSRGGASPKVEAMNRRGAIQRERRGFGLNGSLLFPYPPERRQTGGTWRQAPRRRSGRCPRHIDKPDRRAGHWDRPDLVSVGGCMGTG